MHEKLNVLDFHTRIGPESNTFFLFSIEIDIFFIKRSYSHHIKKCRKRNKYKDAIEK